MSVYTTVGRAELVAWLQPLGLRGLTDFAGIAAGMQNSNYFVTTDQGRWVLTLFERLDTAAIAFYLDLMAHLAGKGFPCPQPRADGAGRLWRPLAGKPAALFTCLAGQDVAAPTTEHCRAVGRALAELHLAGADFPSPLPNPCGAAWCQRVGAALLPLLSPAEGELLADELAFQAGLDRVALPRGVIHADLFRDNVLWDGVGRLSGVLDFYFAGEDSLLLDLAVAANDWCLDDAAVAALVAGYESLRPLVPAEAAAWQALRRAAALRFWLLRLEVRHHPRTGEVVTIKDPDHFRKLLQVLRLAPPELPR